VGRESIMSWVDFYLIGSWRVKYVQFLLVSLIYVAPISCGVFPALWKSMLLFGFLEIEF